jgi:hypothetical protein
MSHDPADTPTTDAEARLRLRDLIKDIRFAMFTSRHANGHLHSRPMTTQNTAMDEDATLWFFMARSGEPVADIAGEAAVNLASVKAPESLPMPMPAPTTTRPHRRCTDGGLPPSPTAIVLTLTADARGCRPGSPAPGG